MNYSIILYVIGWVLNFEAAFMVPACVTGLIYREPETSALAAVALLCLAVGLLITKKKPRSMSLYAKEGFVTVALCWVVLSALGALPFVISRVIPSYVDALFEVVSGFTTTGSSILPEVEHIPHCLLFWRSFTHWIGGMGVLVFVMAVLPLAGGTKTAESLPPTVFAASFTASSGVIPVLMRTAEKFRIMLSTAASTFFCSSCVFCSGRFLFASVSFSMTVLSTGSAPSDLSGLLHSSENVVSMLIVSSDFFPCTTSGAFLLAQKPGFPHFAV